MIGWSDRYYAVSSLFGVLGMGNIMWWNDGSHLFLIFWDGDDEKLDKNVEEVFNDNPSHAMIVDDIR